MKIAQTITFVFVAILFSAVSANAEFTVRKMEHRTFSTGSFNHPEFNQNRFTIQSRELREITHPSISTSEKMDFGSERISKISHDNANRFRVEENRSNERFLQTPELEGRFNERFSNMKLEFQNKQMQHLNFNVEP